MKKLIFAVLCITCFTPAFLHAQYAANALDMSNLFYGGSARFVGMSGAFGAVGGDFSSLSVNPAGLGVYRNHEISFTMNINNTRNFSNYLGQDSEEFRTKFNFNNLGFVFSVPLNTTAKHGMQYVQFGIGYNRLKSFNNSMYFTGFNENNSYLRALSDYATYEGIDGKYPMYPQDLAYLTNLFVDRDGGWYPDRTDHVSQEVIFVTDGAVDEMTLSFGGNYSDKLFFGVTLGIPIMSYRSKYWYSEWDSRGIDTIQFKEMYYDNYYSSTSVGVNGKFGLIYKPIQELRLGVAVHTPTYYGNIEEDQTLYMESFFWDSTRWNNNAKVSNLYQYSLTTPMRVIASAATVIGKVAVISADYEWVNHSKNRLSNMDRAVLTAENDYMKNFYKSQHIVRAGAEVNIRNFYIRGGYGWYSSPYKNSDSGYGSVNSFSAGVGFRAGSFGLDFAYQHARTRSYYTPYNADPFGVWNNDPSPQADVLSKVNNYMLTLSFRY